MNHNGSAHTAAMILGCALLGLGYYFGVTSASQGSLALACLGGGFVALMVSMSLFLKQQKEKERRRMESFMRAVDNMPMDLPVPDPPLDCAPGQVGHQVLQPIEEIQDEEIPQPIIPQPQYAPPETVAPVQYTPPVQQVPVQVPVQQVPVEQYTPPVQEPVQYAPPVQQEPVQEPVAPVQQVPVEQVPVQQVPVQQAPVQEPVEQYTPPVQQVPVQQVPVEQVPVEQAQPNPANQVRVRPSLEKARAEAEEIRAQAMAARNRQSRPPVKQEQRFSPTATRPSLQTKMAEPESAPKISVDDLPSLNQEDWGVYQENNIKGKR